jgi:Cft2 family RNA processing exonuclease
LKIDADPFHFEGLKYVESVEDSRKLMDYTEPCVIISASGTADAGRVRHHMINCIDDANNTVLLAGYCSSIHRRPAAKRRQRDRTVWRSLCRVCRSGPAKRHERAWRQR